MEFRRPQGRVCCRPSRHCDGTPRQSQAQSRHKPWTAGQERPAPEYTASCWKLDIRRCFYHRGVGSSPTGAIGLSFDFLEKSKPPTLHKSMKRCSTCKEDKDINCFSLNKRKTDGHNGVCKECQRKYTKEHYENNKRKYLDRNQRKREEGVDFLKKYKQNRSCPYCGESESCCLDFHHIEKRTNKKALYYLAANYGKNSFIKEIEKCILICSNCHRKIHAGVLDPLV